MPSLSVITTVAVYEIKNLFRSWFFRIFSMMSLGVIVLINAGFFGFRRMPTALQALPSFIPYLNILLLNIVQAIIGGFMATDFLKYDSKLNTTDVVYTRSMSNAEYVLGKTAGVLAVFSVLNVVALINAFVFNTVITDNPVVYKVYLLYPLLVSLPTLLFIFGLSFFIMSVTRNQALTFIILLGYIGISMFFLGDKYYSLFDYLAFNLPLAWSDFIGFSDLHGVLMQRGMYLLFGCSFVSLTILSIKRLNQSRFTNIVTGMVAAAAAVSAFALGGMYIDDIHAGRDLRVEMMRLNEVEANEPRATLDTCDIDLTHAGSEIIVSAGIAITNDNDVPLERLLFSLNPGLVVDSITRGGETLTFRRNLHHIIVDSALSPGAADSLVIDYHGSVNEDACYPDINETVRGEKFSMMLYNIGKRYAMIAPSYVLLTPESVWYPVAGVPYGQAYPVLGKRDFTTFSLEVKTDAALTPLSQGMSEELAPGHVSFEPETPLSRLSLAIGPYVKKSITVDDTEYAAFVLEGHDFFSEYFPDLAPELSGIISQTREEYEDKLWLDYPYNRLSIIETPAMFFTYPRLWTLAQETTQPETVFIPEKAFVLFSADFRQQSHFMERMMSRGNRAMTPEELQSSMFRRFVSSTFTGEPVSFSMIRRGISSRAGTGFSVQRLFLGGIPNHYGTYGLFPLFYAYSRNIYSEQTPLLSTAIELFVSERLTDQRRMRFRMMAGLSDEERANLLLDGTSLGTLLRNPDEYDYLNDVLQLSSSFLFSKIMSRTGSDDFNDALDELLREAAFKSVDTSAFDSTVDELTDGSIDVPTLLDGITGQKELPAYIISTPEVHEIIEDNYTRYQVLVNVSNIGKTDGVVTMDYQAGGFGGGGFGGRGGFGGGGFGGSTETVKRYFDIPAGASYEIGFVLDEEPRTITIDTLISRNLPSIISKRIDSVEEDSGMTPFEGKRESETVMDMKDGEVIVDNEDAGFHVTSNASESALKRLLVKSQPQEDEYIGIQFWNMPRTWKKTTGDSYYGLERRSAHYIRPGNGENKAVWTADIPSSGKYDVSFNVAEIRMPFRGRGPGGGGRNRESEMKDFHFIVHHDDGADEIEIDMSGADEGWAHLGTFYFSGGRATVELSDDSSGRIVYADAVRWTPAK